LVETSEEMYIWELEKALGALLVDTISTRMQPDTIRRQHHHEIIRRFFRFAEAQSIGPINMQVVSASMGVSGRTLRSACQEMLGVSPTQYLLLRRMRMVRRALQQGDPKTTRVTEIATMFGFWELGRFSVRYRQIFGESPSATLRH
jgi:AraC-like DNA-binding protein